MKKEEESIELKRNLSMKVSRSDSDAKEISKLQTEIQVLNLKLMDHVEEVQIKKKLNKNILRMLSLQNWWSRTHYVRMRKLRKKQRSSTSK